jgi:PAT family beta-lactamase induction signal transducer AmpG
MAVFIAMCNKRVSATQYALLTSLSSVGKRVFGWVGGDLVADHGWPTFFGATAAMSIPGLVLVFFLPRVLLQPPAKSARSEKPGDGPADATGRAPGQGASTR